MSIDPAPEVCLTLTQGHKSVHAGYLLQHVRKSQIRKEPTFLAAGVGWQTLWHMDTLAEGTTPERMRFLCATYRKDDQTHC